MRKDRLSKVEDFVQQFIDKKDRFQGFEKHPEILRGWVETYLLDLVNRGRAGQQVTWFPACAWKSGSSPIYT